MFEHKQETGDLLKTALFSDVQFHPVGANDIHRLYRQAKNSISRDFVFDKKVVVPEVTGVTAAYLGFLPANDYLKLVCDEDGSIIDHCSTRTFETSSVSTM